MTTTTYDTPYKYGQAVLAPSGREGAFDYRAVDIPFVFAHRGRFYLTYVGYDDDGYQTGLAVSDDLLHWHPLGVILARSAESRWDQVGQAGTWILKEHNELDQPATLKKVDGKYWMVYHAYPKRGYENGPAEMGLAWCDDDRLLHWHRLDEPIFSWKDGAAWERGGLYKGCLIEHQGTFYLFYNAKNEASQGWHEQIGVATSHDLRHWQRFEHNPVVRVSAHGWDSQFSSDPWVFSDQGRWVMGYFGYDLHHAQDGLAFSDDLWQWTKAGPPVLRYGNPGDIDDIHAHKPAFIRHQGVLYHFYCAARTFQAGDPAINYGVEFRSISVARSIPWSEGSAKHAPC